ncbi:MAG: site-specific integrase [Chitinophagaceae bacterium]|jgi:site-specific recombinase XerD
MTLKIKIPECDWDEKSSLVLSSNPRYSEYNAKIFDFKSKIEKAILMASFNEKEISLDEIVNLVLNKSIKPHSSPAQDIISYGHELSSKLKDAGKIGNSIVYNTAINRLSKFIGTKTAFHQITFKVINDWNTQMHSEGMKVNAISNYMRTIRAIYNRAIKEGIVANSHYPFKDFVIKSESTINRTLTIDELRKIALLDLSTNCIMEDYRNLFMLSYCLIGINLSDLLTIKRENIIDGRLVFKRRKTHKIYSIKIHKKANEYLTGFSKKRSLNNNHFVLPFLSYPIDAVNHKSSISQVIKNTNSNLYRLAIICGITKNLTTYYARYSWANIARLNGYSKDLIAEALGHEYGNKITGIYLDQYSNDVIDEINETVVKSIFL